MSHVFDYHAGIERNTLTPSMKANPEPGRDRPPLKCSIQSVNSLPRSFTPGYRKHMTLAETRWGYESGWSPAASYASQRRAFMSFSDSHKKPEDMKEVPIPEYDKSRAEQAYDIHIWNQRGRQSSPARKSCPPSGFIAARSRGLSPRAQELSRSVPNYEQQLFSRTLSPARLLIEQDYNSTEPQPPPSLSKDNNNNNNFYYSKDDANDVLNYIDEATYTTASQMQSPARHSNRIVNDINDMIDRDYSKTEYYNMNNNATNSNSLNATGAGQQQAPKIDLDSEDFKAVREEAYRRAIASAQMSGEMSVADALDGGEQQAQAQASNDRNDNGNGNFDMASSNQSNNLGAGGNRSLKQSSTRQLKTGNNIRKTNNNDSMNSSRGMNMSALYQQQQQQQQQQQEMLTPNISNSVRNLLASNNSLSVPEPLVEPGKSARSNRRDVAEFVRYNQFLLRSHLTSLFTMLFDDGWISQPERQALNIMARCEDRQLLSHLVRRYAQFVDTHDVEEFVVNLRALVMTAERSQ